MAARWLLLLGSNLPDESCVRTALLALIKLGAPRACTPIRRMRSYDGKGEYFNALAELSCDMQRAELDAALKQLETGLGRRRDASADVAIDIDILARHDGVRWHADAHAVAKGEFAHGAVQDLLQQAGIEVPASGSGPGA